MGKNVRSWQRASRVAFWLSFSLLCIVLCRLTFRFSALLPQPIPGTEKLHTFFRTYLNRDAAAGVFTLLGIVNFSYPYVVAARGASLYGVRLYPVMFSVFPWHGSAYVVYAGLVVLGLYCARMEYLLTAAVCLFGALCAFTSTGIVAIAFALRKDRAVDIILYYLSSSSRVEHAAGKTRKNTRENRERARNERILLIGAYLHAFYGTTQTVQQEPVKELLDTLEKLPFSPQPKGTLSLFLYIRPPCSEKGGPGWETIKTILLARAVCERIFDGLDYSVQSKLLRRFLLAISKCLPEDGDMPAIDPAALSGRGDTKSACILMCGLAAFFKSSVACEIGSAGRWEGWNRIYDRILAVSVYSPADGAASRDDRFRFLLRLLTALMGSCALVEDIALGPGDPAAVGKFWKLQILQAERFDVTINDILNFFGWGQAVLLGSGTPDYDPELSCLRSFHILRLLRALHGESDSRSI